MNFHGSLILDIARNVGFIGICAYLMTRMPSIRRALAYSQYRLQDKVILALVFGSFSAVGNFMGIPVMGSMANTRIVGPIAGGLIGGPWVGIGAGVIGAIPRYFMGGYTMWASILANVVAGGVSGAVYWRFRKQRLNLWVALGTGALAELILKAMVLGLSKPFEQAWELEKIIGIPTIIANSLAVGLFAYIVRDVFQEQEKLQAQSAQQAMRLIQQTTEFLREGLNQSTAAKIARIILSETKAAAVALTDNDRVLAYIGAGSDHHRVNSPVVTAATREAMESLHTVIVNSREGIGCPEPTCPLTGIIDAPLIVDGQLRGTLKLGKTNNEAISAYEAEIIQGIADFLSLILTRRQLDEQKNMLAEAEYNMLKAQVNPHFLFNTMGVIHALVRINPEKARARIKDLSDFLRRTLDHRADLVRLSEELEIVQAYIRLEQARFGDRIRVSFEIAPDVLDALIPAFSLQPLVENAIKHGLATQCDEGSLQIRASQADGILHMTVQDDGKGMPSERLVQIRKFDGTAEREASGAGIGLNNVHNRLRLNFGPAYGLRIESQPGRGTRVEAVLPLTNREEVTK